MYFDSLIKIFKYFGEKRKLKFILFFILALIAGFLEFLGIALIYPFVVMIINPESIAAYYAYIPSMLKSLSPTTLALTIGLVAMLVFVLKNFYMIFYMYVQSLFLQRWTQAINNMLMKIFLNSPYNLIQEISDSDKFYAVNSLSSQVTNGFIMRVLMLCTNSIIVLFVVALILIKFPTAGIITSLFITASVLFQNKVFRAKVADLRDRLLPVSKKMNTLAYSIIKCIKDVKILGIEKEFYEKYTACGKDFVYLNATQNFINSISPYIVETLIVLSLIILAMVITFQNKGQEYVLVASFAVVVASIFRIAPALNRIQTSIINIPATLNFANELITFYEKYNLSTFHYSMKSSKEKIPFEQQIKLENINFSYEKDKNVLSGISLTINKGDFIGIIGLSGAGKSTLADVITGLLPIDSGKMFVDNVMLNAENFSAFRKNIGYVQQELTVLECSFRENVAWGISPEDINNERVIQLLKDVNLWEVVSKYENGIYSVPFVGDSGLSRGQKQRLAIARALYRNPSILLFDEATSALDVKTEHEITTMLQKLGQACTIIVIAHRLSTLQSCNKLIYLNEGKIVDIGNFAELSVKYPDFAELVRLSGLESEKNDKN